MGSPFDQEIFNTLEKPASSDWNRVGNDASYALRAFANSLLLRRVGATSGGNFDASHVDYGFLADGFYVKAVGTMNVLISAGTGFQRNDADLPTNITDGYSISGLSDLSELKPVILVDDKSISLSSFVSTLNPRWVLIEVKYDRHFATPLEGRFILDPNTGTFTNTPVPKALTWALDAVSPNIDASTAINIVAGTAAGSPVRPNPTAGYMPLAYIYLAANATSLDDQSVVLDCRKMLVPNGIINVGGFFETNVTNDGFGANTYCTLPAGWRYAYRLQSASIVSLYIICPSIVGANFAPVASENRKFGLGISHGLQTEYGYIGDIADGTLKTAIGGGSGWTLSNTLDICIGQPYIQIDLVSTGSPVTTWFGGFSAVIPTRL